jgi:Fe-Mn family superoxide dismutase
LVRSGSIVLHELYFANLGGEPKPGGKVLDIIKQWFGSYEEWEDEFKRTANALGGGSGWVIFAQYAHTGEFHNYWSWDHMHNVRRAGRCSCSTCTNTPIISTTAPPQRNT